MRNSAHTERSIRIVEVSPRDGLQNEQAVFTTADKHELVRRAVDAGLHEVEVASFVSPRHVPTMADAEDLLGRLDGDDLPHHRWSALVVNARGVARAAHTSIDELNAVVVCSDTFSQKNQGRTIDEMLDEWEQIARAADDADLPVSITLAAAFGCPFEGEVGVERVADIAGRVAEAQPASISLADTIGVAVPSDVRQRISAVGERIGSIPLRAHFHNTRNTGIANAITAAESGVSILDASLGGIGGCPFAPNATGNIATEDLVYALERSGFRTGVDLDQAIDIGNWLGGLLGRPAPGMVTHAGGFPTRSVDRS